MKKQVLEAIKFKKRLENLRNKGQSREHKATHLITILL